MLLTLDIGNTNVKSALFEYNHLKEFAVHHNSEKLFNYLTKFKFTETAICSVNPSIEKILIDYFSAKDIPLFRANIQNKFNLTIKYDTPNFLGMDRVCSAVGALDTAIKEKLLSKNQYLITIDFGTATTINIVSPSQEFTGGLIAPGISTMLISWKKALELSPDDPLMLYNVACVFGRLGDVESAVKSLKPSIDAGLEDYEWLKTDPDFDTIRNEPAFIEILKGK